MTRFLVKFMKKVLGSDGRQVEVCQRWFEVDAATEADAIESAKEKFCEAEDVPMWSLHADRIHVAHSEFPS